MRRTADQRSVEAEAYRRWYKTSRWQKLRWSILVRDLFTCQMCHRIEADTSKLHCDHVDPKSKATDFWAGPFQTLCAHCHNSDAQMAEKSGRIRKKIGLDGWPVTSPSDKNWMLKKASR